MPRCGHYSICRDIGPTADGSRHIPCVVVQGRYDLVCPVRLFARTTDFGNDCQFQSAYDLAKAWGEGLKLHVVDDAGHSAKEPGTLKKLTEVCANY